MIYEGAPSLKLPALATMMQQQIEEGYRCLYMNSAPMVAGMRSYLSAMGMNVAMEIENGRVVFSSEAPDTGNGFDMDVMLATLEDSLDQALTDGYKGIWITGDMAWEFGGEQNFDKLLAYEWRLEELFRRRPELRGICQYHRDTLPQQALRQGVLAHQTIFINETLSRINPHYLGSASASEQETRNTELDKAVNELCETGDTKS